MRLVSIILPAVALCFGATTVLAATSIKEACGAGKVLSTTVIPYGDQQLTITETHCPGFEALGYNSSRSGNEKRDVQQCNENCSNSCTITATKASFPACQALTNSLASLAFQSFVMTGGTTQTFTLGGACVYTYANYDGYTYDVCYSDFANVGETTANYCIQGIGTGAGICNAPMVQYEYWAVEVSA
ncbi:hypothetical protein SERLA73DRAFT_188442 [Serpula lacrymans var. lacrymans S7.3]|uniref:Uncharacterized protein n=2 Tax=Serpula lacrymans var. lacrymans TaxID=341189 RepID=F8QBB9_SERL3|nr:uncharacterized protein SERLADRAFT_478550 [Serpula lacrymans var. lacrymans S7.9]EGN94505.1 hypothetical protein SERLA73DRAFT_188442 [Serpula lacrymans var. lacrymans S7.3]EGO19981.1 hypothetical protein SERLADRAFT_478550 [Serpula lacrymans var. lacrymans S7.9]